MDEEERRQLSRVIAEASSRGVARALLEHFITREECRARQTLSSRAWWLILGSYVFTAGAAAFVIGLVWGQLAG